MDITLLWLQLAGIAAIILVASTFLAKSADIIAVKTGLGRTFIGVVLLATATSLPELGTGISAVTFVDEPDLAAGDAFGSNLFNLLIIALLDIYWRRGPILNSVGTSSVLIAALGIALISVAAVAVVIHHSTTALDHWYISPVTVVLLACLLGAMFMIYRASQRQDETASQDEEPDYGDASLSRAFATYGLAAAVVVASATLLAVLGDKVAEEMGWEASYVGTQFLALSTSLPELAASFAAIRINAPELALSNLLGSNIFNMGFVLFLDDVAFTHGSLWSHVQEIHTLTAFLALLMTSVVIVGLITRGRTRPGRFWTPEAVLLIAIYVAASVLVFTLG